jgi:cytochrome c biogenesis protein CcdA
VTPLAALPLAFAAGVLTILSPCVLPLAPIVVASGRAEGLAGHLALTAGLALTFGVAGGALASFGIEFGDSTWLRAASGALMLAMGAALLFPAIGHVLEQRLAPAGRAADALRARLPQAGMLREMATVAVLAFAWAPCAGPTLGAAFALAAEGRSLVAAMATMGIYALGAAGALVTLGYGLGRIASRSRWIASAAGAAGRVAFGALMALIGLAALTGLDHRIETILVAAMPDWLTAFATTL